MGVKDTVKALEKELRQLEREIKNRPFADENTAAILNSLGGYPHAGIKVVDSNYQPSHRPHDFCYAVGNTLTADDWFNHPVCGRGLHYSASIAESKRYNHNPDRAVVVIATDEHVEIDSTKSKAKTLYVHSELPMPDREYDEKRARVVHISRALNRYRAAKKELDTFKRDNSKV